MTQIVCRSPIFDDATYVHVAGEKVLIRPYQVVVWVQLKVGEKASPCVPAILDTGHSLNFSIAQDQLVSWADVDLGSLRRIGRTRINRQHFSLYAANLLLRANVAGQRDRFRDQKSQELALREGIVVYPSGDPSAPRLPLLGIRGLLRNGLRTVVDGKRMHVSITKSRRFLGWMTG